MPDSVPVPVSGVWLMKLARPLYRRVAPGVPVAYYAACRSCRSAVGPCFDPTEGWRLSRYCSDCFIAGAFRHVESEPDYPARGNDDPPEFE